VSQLNSSKKYAICQSSAEWSHVVLLGLFGTPQGSPRTDKLIAASVQWAEKIMEKIDEQFSRQKD